MMGDGCFLHDFFIDREWRRRQKHACVSTRPFLTRSSFQNLVFLFYGCSFLIVLWHFQRMSVFIISSIAWRNPSKIIVLVFRF